MKSVFEGDEDSSSVPSTSNNSWNRFVKPLKHRSQNTAEANHKNSLSTKLLLYAHTLTHVCIDMHAVYCEDSNKS